MQDFQKNLGSYLITFNFFCTKSPMKMKYFFPEEGGSCNPSEPHLILLQRSKLCI